MDKSSFRWMCERGAANNLLASQTRSIVVFSRFFPLKCFHRCSMHHPMLRHRNHHRFQHKEELYDTPPTGVFHPLLYCRRYFFVGVSANAAISCCRVYYPEYIVCLHRAVLCKRVVASRAFFHTHGSIRLLYSRAHAVEPKDAFASNTIDSLSLHYYRDLCMYYRWDSFVFFIGLVCTSNLGSGNV